MTYVCPRCTALNTNQTSTCIRCGFHFAAPLPGSLITSAAPRQQGDQQMPLVSSPFQTSPGSLPIGPVQQTRRRRSPLPLFLALLVLLVLLGGGYFALTFLTHGNIPGMGSAQDPTAVLNQICHDLVTKKYRDVYQYESHRMKQQITEEQFVQLAQSSDSLGGGVKTCTVSDVQVNGSTATGKVVATYTTTESTYSVIYHMVLENDGWKVDSNSNQQFGK